MTKPDADELVRRLILRRYREEVTPRRPGGMPVVRRQNPHLADCPDIEVHDPDSGPSSCGEGTCEMAEFTATLRCPHGESLDYRWVDSGDAASCLHEMIEDEERERNPPPLPPPPRPLIEYIRVPRRTT